MAQHYRCAHCGLEFPMAKIQVDHIDPVIDPVMGFVSWDVYLNRLFVPKSALQVLCVGCHQIKTKEEGTHRVRKKASKD